MGLFCVWLRLVHSHDFVWLLLVLPAHNRIETKGLKAVYKSRTGMHLGKFPVVRRILFCRRHSTENASSIITFSFVGETTCPQLFPSNGSCTVACLHSCYMAVGLLVTVFCDANASDVTNLTYVRRGHLHRGKFIFSLPPPHRNTFCLSVLFALAVRHKACTAVRIVAALRRM
jgi:hypothetical protein